MSRRCGLHRDVAARFAIATLFALLFGTDAARSANLTGMWSYSLVTTGDGRDPMGTVSILQSGATVTGDWAEVDPKKEQAFGFEKGERVLEGTIDAARLKGRLRLHYPIANRAACPDGWQTWGDVDIALPETADLLQGEFMSSEINPADCTTKESGWRSFEFVRAVPSESVGTENSTSTERPPTEETPETPVAGTPSRIDIALDEVSAGPGQGLTLQVLLRNDADRRVTADKLYRIRISAENAEVSPDSVEIREGESAAAARVVGERPGEVPIRAASVEDDLKEGRATAITCGSDPITHIVLNAESEEATVGTPIKAVVSLQNDQGVEVAGGVGNKRIRVEVKGVGRFANPGHDVIEEGRCATTLRIAATRAGASPITVSLAALPPEARTFRFRPAGGEPRCGASHWRPCWRLRPGAAELEEQPPLEDRALAHHACGRSDRRRSPSI